MRKLNIHNLVKELNLLCSELQEQYSINHGGCCYLAYLISAELERFGVEYDLVVYDYYKRNRSCVEHEVINCNRNKKLEESITGKHTCDHYCLRIRGAGIVNLHNEDNGNNEYIIPEVPSKNIKWLYKRGRWNMCYSTKNNKIVRKLVKEFFKKYD